MSDATLAAEGGRPLSPPPEEVTRRIGRSSAWLMGAHLLAYGCRFLKVKLIALFFGTTAVLESYQAAFNLPLAINGILFAAILSALVPILVEVEGRRGARGAAALWSRYSLHATGGVALICLALGLAAVPIARLLVDPTRHDVALTAHLLRLQLIYLALLFAVQFIIVIFHSHRRFVFPMLTNLPNLLVNVALIWLILAGPMRGDPPEARIEVLVWGLCAGALVQIVLLAAEGWRSRILRPAWAPTPEIRRAARNTAALLLSFLLSSTTVLILDVIMAAPVERGIAAINYAYAIFMAPFAVGVLNLGHVLLPYLSRQVADRDWSGLSHTLSQTSRVLIYVAIPVSAGMWLVAEDFVRLFEGGAFTPEDTLLVAATLRAFTWGLVFAGLAHVATRVLNAQQRVRAIILVSVIAFGVKIAANALLRGPLGAPGIAWATVLFHALTFALLALWVRRTVPVRIDPALWRTTALTLLGGGVMVVAVLWLRGTLVAAEAGLPMLLGAQILAGAGVWIVWSTALRMREFQMIWGLMRRK